MKKKQKKGQALVVSSAPARALGFMPDVFRTTLRYAEFFTITCTSGALARYEFVANGLYDINFTGTGHQPYGFDQLIAMYSYACVHGCKADLHCMVGPTYEQIHVLLQQGPSVVSLPSDIGTAIERCPTDQWGMVSSYQPVHLKCSGTTEEFTGIKESQQLAETTLYSTSAGNPGIFWYVRIFAQPADGVSTSYLRCVVEFELDVSFFKPVGVASS